MTPPKIEIRLSDDQGLRGHRWLARWKEPDAVNKKPINRLYLGGIFRDEGRLGQELDVFLEQLKKEHHIRPY